MGFRACELQLSFRVTAEGQGAWQIFLGFRFMLLVVRGLEGLWVKAVELESSVPGWWMAGSAVGKMALRQCVCVCADMQARWGQGFYGVVEQTRLLLLVEV